MYTCIRKHSDARLECCTVFRLYTQTWQHSKFNVIVWIKCSIESSFFLYTCEILSGCTILNYCLSMASASLANLNWCIQALHIWYLLNPLRGMRDSVSVQCCHEVEGFGSLHLVCLWGLSVRFTAPVTNSNSIFSFPDLAALLFGMSSFLTKILFPLIKQKRTYSKEWAL